MPRSSKRVVISPTDSNAILEPDLEVLHELTMASSSSLELDALPEETTATPQAFSYTNEENALLLDAFKKLISSKRSWKVARVSWLLPSCLAVFYY